MNTKQHIHITKQTLRFRRWSRKAYAAFISIHRQVSMGQLASSVADRFQAKQLSLHGWLDCTNGTVNFKSEGDLEELSGSGSRERLTLENTAWQVLFLCLYVYQQTKTAHASAYRVNNNYLIRIQASGHPKG